MKTGFLITARLKSTRLPMKVILKVNGIELIRHMINRIKESKVIDEIIICTSPNPQDAPLVKIANEEGIKYFLGDEDDVIQRLSDAAQHFNLDYVINVTADNPLVSPEYITEIYKKYKKTNADHIRCNDLPIGLYSYGLKPEALLKVCETKKSTQTEVWGNYFTKSDLFHIQNIQIPKKYLRNYRLTLDYPEDFEFFKAIFQNFGENTYKVSLDDLINYLDNNPDIVAINSKCQILYEKRREEQKHLAI